MSAAGEGPTLDDRKGELVEALQEFDGRIVVFLDDLDRLTDDEIREIVRLVKLVGDLPNVAYLLSFDRARVEQAQPGVQMAPCPVRVMRRAPICGDSAKGSGQTVDLRTDGVFHVALALVPGELVHPVGHAGQQPAGVDAVL